MVHRVASTTADNNISFATDLHSTTFNSFLLLFLTHFRRQSNKVNQKTFQECFRINQKATYIFAILFTLSPRSPFIALFIIFHKNRYSTRFHSIPLDSIRLHLTHFLFIVRCVFGKYSITPRHMFLYVFPRP